MRLAKILENQSSAFGKQTPKCLMLCAWRAQAGLCFPGNLCMSSLVICWNDSPVRVLCDIAFVAFLQMYFFLFRTDPEQQEKQAAL